MRLLTCLLAVLLCCACATATRPAGAAAKLEGEAASSPLFREIADEDAALSAAFNAHDLDALMQLFAGDLEFYHDAGGLQTFGAVREGFGKLFAKNDGIRRDLVPGTLRVFPVKGYGAVELGTHRFCHTENGRRDCGTFEFVQIWRHDAERWKLARVVSYGH